MDKAKKSRQGCATCKRKKVKCDETKPSCLRCQRTRQPCPGYRQNLKWSDKHEVFTKSTLGRDTTHSMTTTDSRHLAAHTGDDIDGPIQIAASTLSPDFLECTNGLEDLAAQFVLDDTSLLLDNSTWLNKNLATFSDPSSSPLPLVAALERAFNALPNPLPETAPPCAQHQDLANTSRSLVTPESIQEEQAQGFLSPVSIPQTLTDQSSVLVEYYFGSVAPLYSCFDGNLNPFRTIVGRLWDSSYITNLTLQSMAAACLSRDFPHLAQQGATLRKQAVEQISQDLDAGHRSDISLLCLIMLGQSTAWHNVGDLGVRQYYDARRLLIENTASRDALSTSNNLRFFHQAMGYWRMILSFASESGELDDQEDDPVVDTDLVLQAVPHPWALIVPDMMSTISQIGRLVYNHRRKFRNQKFWQEAHLMEMHRMLLICRRLEALILKYQLPAEAEIVDPGDNCTPRWHFLKITEAYRIISLIHLYRVFPDVLFDRVRSKEHVSSFDNVPQVQSTDNSQASETDAQEWLKQLVFYAIDVLAEIPFESHTRSIQAFLLVALSSELRKPALDDIGYEAVRVVQARNLVRSRLEAYRYVFAPKPAQRKLDLVLKVWDLMDSTNAPVFWIDVMIDNGLQVVFC